MAYKEATVDHATSAMQVSTMGTILLQYNFPQSSLDP